MFAPVSAEVFWSSAAGNEYAERFLARDMAKNRGIDGATLKSNIARWQTGNYDQNTGLCTLYRGVDAVRFAVAKSTGLITTRCVEVFGDADVPTAIAALRDTVKGTMPRHVRNNLAPRIESSELAIQTMGEWKKYPDFMDAEEKAGWLAMDQAEGRKSLDKVIAIAEGNANPEVSIRLSKAADLLTAAAQLGECAYLLAAQEAAQDECPNLSGIISIDDLVHTSIHLSTDATKAAQFGHDGGVLRLDFEPGMLPVAPERGYIWGGYQTDGIGYRKEEEWYGIGQLAHSECVSIAPLYTPSSSRVI